MDEDLEMAIMGMEEDLEVSLDCDLCILIYLIIMYLGLWLLFRF